VPRANAEAIPAVIFSMVATRRLLLVLALFVTPSGCGGRASMPPSDALNSARFYAAPAAGQSGGGYLYIANAGGSGSVSVYALGDTTPLRTITAGVSNPGALAVDASGVCTSPTFRDRTAVRSPNTLAARARCCARSRTSFHTRTPITCNPCHQSAEEPRDAVASRRLLD
jgi:hypothetical protein